MKDAPHTRDDCTYWQQRVPVIRYRLGLADMVRLAEPQPLLGAGCPVCGKPAPSAN